MDEDKQKQFFQKIKLGDEEFVETFLKENDVIKFIYDDNKQSAAALALSENRINIYKILVSHGYDVGPHEKFKLLCANLSEAGKLEVKLIQDCFAKSLALPYLCNLLHASKHAAGNLKSEQADFHRLVNAAFEEMNQIELIEPMLKVVGYAEEISIKFDFYRDTVENLDPTANVDTEGNCYQHDGDINIGAKWLLENDKRNFVLGTLAHELCHYALQLIYHNDTKPYFKRDKLKAGEFQAVFEACKAKRHLEPIVDVVFKYPKKQQHAELIVRVPHVLLCYKDNEEKLEELRENFAELFEFYETKICDAFKRKYPKMEMRQKVKGLNDLLRYFPQLNGHQLVLKPEALKFSIEEIRGFILESNCPALTVSAIHQQLSKEKYFSSTYLFTKLESLKDETILSLTLETLKEATNWFLIVDCSQEKKEMILKTVEKMRNEKIIFVMKDNVMNKRCESKTISHFWDDLTMESQEKLLSCEVNFRGQMMVLKTLVVEPSNTLKQISLEDLIEGKMMVGKEMNLQLPENYIQREFLLDKKEEFTRNKHILSNETVKLPNDGRILLISEEPGTGKSTELRQIALEIARRAPAVWVEFIDMKMFYENYERDGNVSLTFKNPGSITDYLCTKILMLDGFDREMFNHLFNNNRVALFFDGFDEISSRYKQFNLKLVKAIESLTRNLLCVSTRRNLEEELVSMFNVPVTRILPISPEDRNKFFVDKMKKLNLDEKVIAEKLEKLEEFFYNIEMGAGQMSSPIALEMVSEILIDDSTINFSKESIYSVYKSFRKKVFKDCQKRGVLAQEECASYMSGEVDINAFHYKKAFEELFPFIEDKIEACFSKKNLTMNIDQMSRVGFLTALDSKVVRFVHRTYAEFFAAEFFIRNVFTDTRDEAAIQLLKYFWLNRSGSFTMIQIFLDAFIGEKNNSTNCTKIFEETFSGRELTEVFKLLVSGSSFNLIKTFAKFKSKHLLQRLWKLKYDGNLNRNVLHAACLSLSTAALEDFLTLTSDILKKNEIRALMKGVNSLGWNCFHSAIMNENSGVLHFLLTSPLVPLTRSDHKDQLKAIDKSGRSLIATAMECLKFNEFESSLIDPNNTDVYAILIVVSIVSRLDDLKVLLEHLKIHFTKSETDKLLPIYPGNVSKKWFVPFLLRARSQEKTLLESFWSFLVNSLNNNVDRFDSSRLSELNHIALDHRENICIIVTNFVDNSLRDKLKPLLFRQEVSLTFEELMSYWKCLDELPREEIQKILIDSYQEENWFLCPSVTMTTRLGRGSTLERLQIQFLKFPVLNEQK